MATVYLARDLKHDGREVAVKVLRPEIAALLGRDRFVREIDLVARLNHPHILPLHDSDEARPRGEQGHAYLYYVMPFVAGGSLCDRLAAEPRMAVEPALELILQVADALTYAHGLGIVHRDIKPGNILLAGAHAYVADFGIARAIRQAMTEDHLTEAGLILGSPPYMAPEQFQSASQVDGRADEYALACVLHEMLLGDAPDRTALWSGPAPPSLRKQRPDIPVHVDNAIRKGLATARSDRFATVLDFAAALRGERRPAWRSRLPRQLTGQWGEAVAAIALVAAVLWSVQRWMQPPVSGIGPDTTRYAILPFESASDGTSGLDQEQRLRSALRRWEGLEPVDPVRVREEVERRGGRRLSGSDAVAISHLVGAGRYLRGSISRAGDSLRVAGALYAVSSTGDSLLAEHTVSLGPGQAQGEEPWNDLVDHLLLRGALPAGGFGALGTHALPAWQAFRAGQQALREWRLPAADSAFTLAEQYDGEFARADLWLGLSRLWNGADPASWQHAAEQAAAGRSRLTPTEQPMADALVSAARGELDRSCSAWKALAERSPNEFAAWYGWAHCQQSDDTVVRDGRSPSGWSFRSSYRSALRAYQRAFLLRSAVLASLRVGSYKSVRALLKTSGNDLRMGSALPPDSMQFLAYPGWYQDTLGFIPYPLREFSTVRMDATRATQEQRRLFHKIALSWVSAAPRNPDALEALGISLGMLGDPSATDTLRRARALTRGRIDRLRVAGAEVWSIVRFSVPNAPEKLLTARALIDSLLREFPASPPVESGLLAGLASLTGRANLAAAYSRQAAIGESWMLPRPFIDVAPALMTFAALGGPRDSLDRLERLGLAMIDRDLPEAERSLALDQWMGRATSLSFSDHVPLDLRRLGRRGHLLVDAQLAFQLGRADSARAILGYLRRQREGVAASTFTLDALYPEARLLLALGDTATAAGWMRPTLNSLRFTAPEVLSDPWRAASLVRAAALQAELDQMRGEPEDAGRWARCVLILWSDADDFLQPTLNRLRRIAGR